MFKKAAVFTDIHFGLKGNSKVHNQDCEDFIDWYIKEAKANGKLDMFRASWIADYPDAENYLSLYYSKNFAPNGSNYFHFKSTLFDSLYNKAFTVIDIEERKHLYTTMVLLNGA